MKTRMRFAAALRAASVVLVIGAVALLSRGDRAVREEKATAALPQAGPAEPPPVTPERPKREPLAREAAAPAGPDAPAAVGIQESGMLRGVAVDAEDRPVAEVHLFGRFIDTEDGEPWDTHSAEDGSFALEPMTGHAVGESALFAVADGFAPVEIVAQEIGRGPLRIVLRPGRTVHGFVGDEDGNPIAGASVAWLPNSFVGCWGPGQFPFDSPRVCRARMDGSYDLHEVPEGRGGKVVATSLEYATGHSTTGSSGGEDFALKRVGSIEGVVADSLTGAPLEGVRIDDGSVTDASGRFVANATGWDFHGRKATATLRFRKEGFAAKREFVRRPPPGQIARIKLRPVAHLSGFVRDAEGNPMAGAEVYPQYTFEDWPEGESGDLLDSGARTARDGSFRLELPAGILWTVHVRAQAVPEVKFTNILANQGDTLERTFIVGEGREVRGRVLARDSRKPIPGAWVNVMTVSDEGGRLTSQLRCRQSTDTDGRFHIRGLSDERAWLSTGAADFVRCTKELPSGPVADLECTLEPGLVVEGTVVDADDQPVPMAVVTLKAEIAELPLALGDWERRTADQEGHVRFERRGAIGHLLTVEPPRSRARDLAPIEGIALVPPVTKGRWVLPHR